MDSKLTHTYGFDSKRDAQTKRVVGSKTWAADVVDHSKPDSLLIVVGNGPVEYNASGPVYWGKEVTYRRATEAEWAPARAREIEGQLLPRLSPHYDRDKWIDGVLVAPADLTADEITDRAEYTALKAELGQLRAVVVA